MNCSKQQIIKHEPNVNYDIKLEFNLPSVAIFLLFFPSCELLFDYRVTLLDTHRDVTRGRQNLLTIGHTETNQTVMT